MFRENEIDEFSKEDKKTFWKILAGIIGFGVILTLTGFVFGWFGEATKVAHDEYGPKAMMAKYEWFKDQSNRIKKAQADISLFETNLKAVGLQYEGYGKDQSKWPLDIRMQYNTTKQNARADLMAIVSNYNNLVRDYNSQSSKFNWSPFNADKDKPQEKLDEYVVPAGL